mgnify:CR=1 FL=1
MSIKKLYAGDGRFLGDRVDQPDRVKLYGSDGRYLGEYMKQEDRTYDSTGRFIGTGDLLGSLLTP